MLNSDRQIKSSSGNLYTTWPTPLHPQAARALRYTAFVLLVVIALGALFPGTNLSSPERQAVLVFAATTGALAIKMLAFMILRDIGRWRAAND